MRRVVGLVVIMLAVGLATACWAHDYWIMPETFSPRPCSVVRAAFTCGHKYFPNTEVPDITLFKPSVVLPSGQRVELAWYGVGKGAAWVKVPVLGEGTYTIVAASPSPQIWTRTAHGYALGTKADVPGAVESGAYYKSTKTFLQVGKSSPTWKQPLGLVVEIVPKVNPCAVKKGQSFSFQVLLRGKPVAGAQIAAFPDGYTPPTHGQAPITSQSDERGMASVRLDKPGVWLIMARYQRRTKGKSLVDYENYRAYVLLKVRE